MIFVSPRSGEWTTVDGWAVDTIAAIDAVFGGGSQVPLAVYGQAALGQARNQPARPSRSEALPALADALARQWPEMLADDIFDGLEAGWPTDAVVR